MDVPGILMGIREARWGLRAKPHELEDISQKRLRAIVDRAYRNVPFYSRIFRTRNISPDQVRDLDDLSKLPVLTNRDVIDSWAQMVDQEFKIERCVCNRTSGSTGQPIAFLHEPRAFYRLMGISLRGQIEGGLRFRHKVALVRPKLLGTTLFTEKLYTVLSSVGRVKFWSTSHDIRETLHGLHKFRPDVLKTYPHFLRLAAHEKEDFTCPLIFTDSEILDAETRKIAEESYRCRIVDLYDSVEFPSIAWQCRTSSLYHVDSDAVAVQSLKLHSDLPADFGERGRIVVTGLINHAMPLIRYATGDIGILTDEECGCGVRLPLMKSIEGRVVDCIRLPSGRVISPYILVKWMSAKSVGIKQYQIIQEEKNRLLVKVVLDSRARKGTLTKLALNLRQLITEPVIVETKAVNSIPRETSGKYRIVSSKLI
jgi:phenylacetate-CoA ligase